MDRPGFPRQSPETRQEPGGHSNPLARVAALTGHPATSPAETGVAPRAPIISRSPTAAATPDVGVPVPATTPESGGSMKSPQVGRLTHVSATLLWPTDAAFAAWLGDNLEALAEATSLKLSQPQLMDGETAIVLAAQETGGSAVIVCQRAGSTDAAFGALARHLAASTARHAVWICGEPYEEHGAAVSWLNRAIDGRFVMVKVGAVTIGDSAAAPTFELVVRSPRADDAGVESTVPTASADASVSSRRAGDWLAGAGEDAQSG